MNRLRKRPTGDRGRRYGLVVFDWDGTLMDSVDRIVACIGAAIRDLDLPERSRAEMADIIGLGLREAIEQLYPGKDETFARRFVQSYREHFLERDPTPTRLFPGARETLRSLHAADYRLAVATGKGRRGLDEILERTGCRRYFHATRCADEARSKPHPEMLHAILDELDIEPSAALMVGDTEYDMQMARDAGVAAIAVAYGVHSPERLLRHDPLACLSDIRELPDWLARAD